MSGDLDRPYEGAFLGRTHVFALRAYFEDTDVSALISPGDTERVKAWIDEAVEGGAKVVVGGDTTADGVLRPTVLTGVTPDMRVCRDEVFGPVLAVAAYDTVDEAIEIANDTRYGLQAGIFTRDANAIFRAYNKLDVGGVMAGDIPSFRIDHMPYGGTKDSGLGREGLRYAIEEMTEPKLLVMNLR